MTIGEFLREAREEGGYTVKDVAGKLQIPVRVIEVLEQGDISKMPPRVYSRGFLKKYAEYLGLPVDEALEEFDRMGGDDEFRLPAPLTKPKPTEHFLAFDRRGVSIFILFAAFLMAGVYFLHSFRYAFGEPQLIIKTPAGDMSVETYQVSISGVAERGADVTLNGRVLPVSESGEFEEVALLRDGLNILEFQAKNRFGKTRNVARYVFVK